MIHTTTYRAMFIICPKKLIKKTDVESSSGFVKINGKKNAHTMIKVIKKVSTRAFPQILERLFSKVVGLMNKVLYKWEAINPDKAKRQNWIT